MCSLVFLCIRVALVRSLFRLERCSRRLGFCGRAIGTGGRCICSVIHDTCYYRVLPYPVGSHRPRLVPHTRTVIRVT